MSLLKVVKMESNQIYIIMLYLILKRRRLMGFTAEKLRTHFNISR